MVNLLYYLRMITTKASSPRHETPNAVMHTLAAPSLGSRELSVWEVAMDAGQSGPAHTADHEQVLVLLEGALRCELGAEVVNVTPGDAIVLPAGGERRIHAEARSRALVASAAAPSVTTPDGSRRPLTWAQ